MSARLELKAVRKSFDDVDAVKGIDLSLGEGEFLSLLGPSGCGKSTTLAMIAGFVVPDSGEIVVDGKLMNTVPPQRRKIGLVFQDYAVFSRLTVHSNLAFGLEAQRVRRAERQRRIAAMAETLDLTKLMGRRGSDLNMSEMQRVAMARALVTEPRLLLLDEPMSNLDAAPRAALRVELKQIQRDLQQTVLYVTHDQVEAMSMSDRIAVMREGRLLQVGAPDEIYHHPINRFVAEFIGDPPINIIPCEVMRSGEEVAIKTALHGPIVLGRGTIAPGHHSLGVRPHDLHLTKLGDGAGMATTVRFVENFGADHVLHVDYGEQLVAVTTEPGFAEAGDMVYIDLDFRRAHLFDRGDDLAVAMRPTEAVA